MYPVRAGRIVRVGELSPLHRSAIHEEHSLDDDFIVSSTQAMQDGVGYMAVP